MTRYHVYFIRLSQAQTDQINHDGWSSPAGAAYLTAKSREFDYSAAFEAGMIELAAIIDIDTDLEGVWATLQNLERSWRDHPQVQCLTSSPRSCDVGDIIVPAGEPPMRVSAFGFDPLSEADVQRLDRLFKFVVHYDGKLLGYEYGQSEHQAIAKLMERNPHHLRELFSLTAPLT